MRDKTDQILKAALEVFAQKGYNESTTQEIANEAQVAEITIYRKFKSKQNLFISTIQSIVMSRFDKRIMEYAEQEDTEQFMSYVLEERLTAISKNQLIIKTLVSESLMGRLDQEIDLPKIMFQTIKRAMDVHFSKKTLEVDTDKIVRILSGLLISYIIWAPSVPYHKLGQDKKRELIERYIQILNSCWKQ